MLSGPQKNEVTKVDMQPNIAPQYPAWVEEFINRRIDAAIDRAKRENTSRRIDPIAVVKPKPR